MLSFNAQHNKCHLNIGFTINPNQQVRANPAKRLARESLIIILLTSRNVAAWHRERPVNIGKKVSYVNETFSMLSFHA